MNRKIQQRLQWVKLYETSGDAGIAEYCRKKGLYPAQIIQWKQAFLQVPSIDDKTVISKNKK
ncbi:hypothetical protein [Serratia proteamaculans]|jgi:hypothetical protein